MAEGWRVIGQRQFEDLTSGGRFETMVEINFELASGTTGSVKIPARLYTEDHVREEVSRLAATMMAIENL